MSALTKILIVLLTISSIFLCGIVVTYVANANNYRQMYLELRAERDAAVKNEEGARKQLNETIQQTNQEKQKLHEEIASLQTQLNKLQGELATVGAERDDALRRVNNWASIVMDFSKTTDNQGRLLKNTLDELEKLRAEDIKKGKELKQTTNTLLEKMAIISTLQAQAKRLQEEKTELQTKLNQLLRQYGKVIAAPTPVTPKKEKVTEAPVAREIGLKGKVTAVDPKNSMAEISIGAAHGVKQDMKFHVTRGDEFICDILILDVDAEKAVGILDLVQTMPKVGDSVSTNL